MPRSTFDPYVKVAVMGATGTGKSTFIHLLTCGDDVDITHCSKSEVSDVETTYYTDARTGRTVMLIETPGFYDPRENITDTDILQRIIDFLQPPIGERITLNGIIFLHCISEPYAGSLSRKNLRMFEAICGEKCLLNVHVVTTNWDHVSEEEGSLREDELKKGAFQALLKGGAQIRRHTNTVDSARRIMSELIPLQDITTQLQDQVAKGTPLLETDAGRIINQDLEELRDSHAEELSHAQKEMEEVAQANSDYALAAELDAKCKLLESKVIRAEEDQQRLKMGIGEVRRQQEIERKALDDFRSASVEVTAKLEEERERARSEGRRLREQLERGSNQRRVETPRRRQERVRQVEEAEQRVAVLDKQLGEIEDQKRKAEDYASHGIFSRFIRDWEEGGTAVSALRRRVV